MPDKPRIATASLAGCFGCHMSLLDMDERLLDLVEKVEFDRTPLTDIKVLGDCDIGIIEGGIANQENLEVAHEFRHHCRILVALGACAVNGGIPAMRNQFSLQECLAESYIDGIGVDHPMIPSDAEIPLLTNKVYPLHEVVAVDYFLPGCPPTADAIYGFIHDLLMGGPVNQYSQPNHFD